MEKHLSWKAKFSILMVVLIIVIYGSNYLVLGDAEHIISYVWTHLGFIPVDILLVAFLLDEIIERKEKEAMLEKLDMLMSTFFSEVGNNLIKQLSTVNEHKANTENLKSIKTAPSACPSAWTSSPWTPCPTTRPSSAVKPAEPGGGGVCSSYEAPRAPPSPSSSPSAQRPRWSCTACTGDFEHCA